MNLYHIHQNNSGGSFRKPAVNIVVRAKSEDEALALAAKYVTFCRDDGSYAAYDECGCCPCCGHRWYPSAHSETPEEIAAYVGRFGQWGNTPMLAVIDTDGTMRVGTTEGEDAALRKELSEVRE